MQTRKMQYKYPFLHKVSHKQIKSNGLLCDGLCLNFQTLQLFEEMHNSHYRN